MIKDPRSGQSLAEILVATTVGAIIIGAVVSAIVITMRSDAQNRLASTATSLANGLLDNVQSLADGDWSAIYNLPTKGPTSQYYLVTTGTPPTLSVSTGTDATVKNGVTFTRYFSVQDVNRTNCGTGTITTSSPTSCSGGVGILQDPSTELVTAYVSWTNVGGASSTVSVPTYLAHSKDRVTQYNDWSGSANVQGPVTSPQPDYASSSNISTSTSGAIELLKY